MDHPDRHRSWGFRLVSLRSGEALRTGSTVAARSARGRLPEWGVTRDPNPTSASATESTTAWAPTWPASRFGVLCDELLTRFRMIEAAGPIEWAHSNRHTGIRHHPLVLHR